MTKQEESRICLWCKIPIQGRKDKVFCRPGHGAAYRTSQSRSDKYDGIGRKVSI